MKKSKKTVIITLCIAAVLLTVFTAGRVSFAIFKERLENNIFPLKDPVDVINSEYRRNEGIIVDWIFSPDDLEKNAGFADYVFVAEVKEVVGTGYTEVRNYDGFGFDCQPFTKYKIRVLENIKGNLKTDRDITLTKHDGVYYFGKSVSLYDGDMLPDEGECYIFLCKCDEDGELNIGSFSGHTDIYLCSRESYTGKEELTELYREAVENMDESVRIGESYKCRYDAEK